MSPRKMRKAELLDYLAQGRRMLYLAIKGLSDEEASIPELVGDWSMKDILAHITAWDKETRSVIEEALSPEHTKFDYTISGARGFAKWNARQVAKRQGMSLGQILGEMREARRQLIRLVRGLSEESLSRRFIPPWRWPTSPQRNLQIQAQHDMEHAEQIMAARKGRPCDTSS